MLLLFLAIKPDMNCLFFINYLISNQMKKFILLMLLFLLNVVTSPSAVANTEVNVPTITSDFNEGWKDGYCEGWRDVKGQYTICPIAPISPIPPIGHDSYKGGYNLGFKAGSKAANN